jgi:UDP-N-acetylglucosamine--dolichyl-phosphate N-acetylglucosaminephosphotransferase
MKLTAYHLAGVVLILIAVLGTFSLPSLGYLWILLASVSVTMVLLDKLIPKLQAAGMTGADENKPGNPQIAEMGGIAVIAGFTAGALLAILVLAILSFRAPSFNLVYFLAAIITIHSIAFMGIVDDFISMPQWLKAVLPLFAAIPLMVVGAAGSTIVHIPFIGAVQFGIIYIAVLIPVAVAVCSNLTNMLAGFNGMEAGMGIVIFSTLALLAASHGSTTMLLVCLPMLGGLVGFLFFNWYPAKVFPGDVMNLTIGVAVATSVIIGNLQTAGMILMAPYILDFFIKAANRFPHTYQELRGGKLSPKSGAVKGLVHVVMKAAGRDGISEKGLTTVFMGLELFCALVALALYYRF